MTQENCCPYACMQAQGMAPEGKFSSCLYVLGQLTCAGAGACLGSIGEGALALGTAGLVGVCGLVSRLGAR